MVKHIVICDKCGKEENMKQDWETKIYNIPDNWKHFGIHKYLLCPECRNVLTSILESEIYKFVELQDKEGD